MRVLLLDDHPLILDALGQLLQRLDPTVEVCPAEHPDQAFALLAGSAPVDLVFLDLKLGEGIDGFEVLAQLRQLHPEAPVTVLSGTDRLNDVVRVIDGGAMGFIPKRASRDEMNRALAMVLSGGVYLPQALLELITRWQGRVGELGDTTIDAAVAQLAAADAAEAAGLARAAGPGAAAPASAAAGPAPGAPGTRPPMPAAPGPAGPAAGAPAGAPLASGNSLDTLGLTPRQTEVLRLLLRALPNKLIARELNLSVETVKDHVAAVLRALGVASRTQAVLAVSRLTAQDPLPLRWQTPPSPLSPLPPGPPGPP